MDPAVLAAGLIDWKSSQYMAEPPDLSEEGKLLRDHIFRYQNIRRNMRTLTQHAGRLIYLELMSILPQRNQPSEELQVPLRQLHLLELTQQECNQALSSTTLEQEIRSRMAEILAQEINVSHGTQISSESFALPISLWDTRTSPSPIPSDSGLSEYDTQLTQAVKYIMSSVNLDRLLTNLKDFHSISRKIPGLEKDSLAGTNSAGQIDSGLIHPVNFINNNFFHAKILFDSLKNQKTVSVNTRVVDDLWEDLTRIIALCCGCTNEPGFFLSLVDHILDQLQIDFGIPFDSHLDLGPTFDFHAELREDDSGKIIYGLFSGSSHTRNVFASEARMQMAELATCIRGCIFIGSIITKNRGTNITTENSSQRYNELLTWDDKCAICGDTLLAVQDSGLHIDLRGISPGDLCARNTICQNLVSIYNYPAVFLLCDFWGQADGPLFFHFARFSHRNCKHFRDVPSY